jgi:type IV secretory pathway VirB10-like protein
MLEINAAPINDNMVFDDTLTNNAFSDTINIVPTIIKRDGTFIKHRTELK